MIVPAPANLHSVTAPTVSPLRVDAGRPVPPGRNLLAVRRFKRVRDCLDGSEKRVRVRSLAAQPWGARWANFGP